MARDNLPKHLIWRGGLIHYARRVPTEYADLDPRVYVRASTKTTDIKTAIAARDVLDAELERYWQELAQGQGEKAIERHKAALAYARRAGYDYVAATTLAHPDRIGDLFSRIGGYIDHLRSTGPNPSSAEDDLAIDGVLGVADDPGVRLSTLFETYEGLTADERRGKSQAQLHKWRLPRLRAIKNLTSVVGDKLLTDLTRADSVTFRGWWSDRIQDEETPLKPETANKDMTNLSAMITRVSDIVGLNLPAPFRGLRFRPGAKESPPPFSTQFIRERFLADGALDGLNPDARSIVMMMIETGARPIELAHLTPAHIRLDADVPHIVIERQDDYQLKTPFSNREIPLVGVAAEGARLFLASGTNRYRGNTDTLSATVGKFFEENGLRESERHTLYSFRHAFRDRLTDVSAPDIIDTKLMGHKPKGMDYGKGPTLERKLEWILKIAVSL